MENTRYDYLPIIKRERFELPNNAKVAIWIGINIEYFGIETTNFGGVGAFQVSPPNVYDYAARDYGNRIGLWRLMEVLDKYNIKASVLLNSEVCNHYPIIIEEGNKRGWEWVGHGMTNADLLNGKTEEDERRIISTTLDFIEKGTGQRPVGWLGPALQETFNTPDILAELGVRYLCDWCCDDQPFSMKVKQGNMISIPYSLDLNDIPAFLMQNLIPDQFYTLIKDQFDTLYNDSSNQSFIMCISLHPFLIGQPFRIGCLDEALKYIKSHKNIWFATAREMAAWYYDKYLNLKI